MHISDIDLRLLRVFRAVVEAGGFTNDFLANNGLLEGNRVIAGPKGLKAELMRLTEHWR